MELDYNYDDESAFTFKNLKQLLLVVNDIFFYINNNTIVYPETDGSKPSRLKKRSFKRSMYGLNKRPTSFKKRERQRNLC